MDGGSGVYKDKVNVINLSPMSRIDRNVGLFNYHHVRFNGSFLVLAGRRKFKSMDVGWPTVKECHYHGNYAILRQLYSAVTGTSFPLRRSHGRGK